jgi:hypothetical protein
METKAMMEGQTGEGQHEFAMQYLRRELASCLWQARSGNVGEDFTFEANEFTRILVNRCPERLRDAADKLQHIVINRQLQMLVGRMYFRRKGQVYPLKPKRVLVNAIAPKVELAACMIG